MNKLVKKNIKDQNLTYEECLNLLAEEHKMKMEELQYVRETERLKHEWEKERMRIKSAEIRKSLGLKYQKPF